MPTWLRTRIRNGRVNAPCWRHPGWRLRRNTDYRKRLRWAREKRRVLRSY